jgi:hypothetical protein
MYLRQQSDHARKRFFSCWQQQSRFSRRSCTWVVRTFSMRPRTQIRLALLHWRQISCAAKPLIRCKLVVVKADRWYRSLLMRTCLSVWDEHVVNGLRVIHSHARIKQGSLASWKAAVKRQKRLRRVEAVISRHSKLLSSRLVSSLVRAWSAVQKKSKRLHKARHLLSRRGRRSSLKAALGRWLQGQSLVRLSRHARRRAAVKLRSVYIRVWKESLWRRKRCACVSGMVTAHERRGVEAEKFACFMTWARMSALGQAQAKKLSKADRLHRSHMKAATCMTWNQESWAAKVSRQLRQKSERAG